MPIPAPRRRESRFERRRPATTLDHNDDHDDGDYDGDDEDGGDTDGDDEDDEVTFILGQ